MEQQLELSLIENIKRTFEEAQALAQETSIKGKAAIMKARECGQLMIEAKATAGHGKWIEWFNENRHRIGDFGISTAKNWMRLAETPLEQLEISLNLRQAYIAAGIIPEPHRAEQQSQSSASGGCKWISLVDRTFAELDHLKEQIPGWAETQKVTLKEKLRPLVEVYNSI